MSNKTYRCPRCGGHKLQIKAMMEVDLTVRFNEEGGQYLDFVEENMAGLPHIGARCTAVCGDCLAVGPLALFTTEEGETPCVTPQ